MVNVARSICFIQFSAAVVGWSKAFSVPQGYTALLKSAVIMNTTAAAARGVISLGSSAGGFAANVWDVQIAANTQQERTFAVCVTPGDYIVCYAAATGLNFWVSGALMPSPPYFPPAVGAGLLNLAGLPDLTPLPAV